MNLTAAVLLALSLCLLVAGAWMLAPAAGVLTAGVLAGAAGVLSLKAGSTKTDKKEPR
jgi:hypothetical protein